MRKLRSTGGLFCFVPFYPRFLLDYLIVWDAPTGWRTAKARLMVCRVLSRRVLPLPLPRAPAIP